MTANPTPLRNTALDRERRREALQHRSAASDLNPHLRQKRMLLQQPMPGSPLVEGGGILAGTRLDADATIPTPDENPNAHLVLEFAATFGGNDYGSPTHAAIQSHPRFREAAQRQRHLTPLDATDETTRRVLAQAYGETATPTD